MNKKFFLQVVGIISMLVSMTANSEVISVKVKPSASEYNQFIFKQPFSSAVLSDQDILQEGDDAVKTLNQKRLLMLRIKESKDPSQLTVVLQDGTVKIFKLIADPSLEEPTIWPRTTATNRPNDNYFVPKETADLVALLKEFAETGKVEGFNEITPKNLGDTIYSDPLTIQPVKGISNGDIRIVEFSLTSRIPVEVSPRDFNSPRVMAIDLIAERIYQKPESLVIVYKESEGGE